MPDPGGQLPCGRASPSAGVDPEVVSQKGVTCCLQGHMEEVDAVACRVDVAARQLDSLRQTSVLEDCFHIWCDTPAPPCTIPSAADQRHGLQQA